MDNQWKSREEKSIHRLYTGDRPTVLEMLGMIFEFKLLINKALKKLYTGLLLLNNNNKL